MKPKVEVKGLKELQDFLKHMTKEQKKEVREEVYASSLDVQKLARENLKTQKAWKTGFLANSITLEPDNPNMAIEIGPEAPYGIYIEVGTKKMGARPYLFPAHAVVEDKFFDRLMEIFKRSR